MEEENNAANQPEILVKFSNVQDIKGKVHSIPARIKFSGKGNIESFFVPETYTPRREIDDVYKHNKQTLERHLLSNYNLEKKEDKNQLNEELLQEANFRGRLLIGKEIELNTYDLKGIVLKESNITEDDQLNGESNTESSYLNTKYNFQRKFDCEKTFNVINYWSRDVPPTKLDRIFEWMKWPSLSAAIHKEIKPPAPKVQSKPSSSRKQKRKNRDEEENEVEGSSLQPNKKIKITEQEENPVE